MAGQGKLFNFFNLIGNYKSVFNNRLTTVIPCYVQNAGLKMKTKEKLKNLHIPEFPKRPLSPFFRFLAEQRPLLLKKHPEWKVAEIAKQCAVDWKTVAADTKKKYHEEYGKDLLVFEEKNKQCISSLTQEQSDAIAAAKKEKRKSKEKRQLNKLYRETDKPKRPKGSFIFFISEKWALPENKDMKLGEILVKYKEEWSTLSDDKKAKYIKMQKEAADKYNEEMLRWEAKMVADGNSKLVRKDRRYIATSKPSILKNPKLKKIR